MNRIQLPSAILVLALPLLLLALSASACNILDEGGTPKNARILIEGGGGQAFQLVTSNNFDLVSDDDGETHEVFFYAADTTSVTPGFDQRYSLGSGVRFFVKASSEAALAQPINLQVFIDGDRRYNATSDLGDSGLEFLYSFR